MRENKFKMTEVGLVSEDWEVKSIEECFDLGNGYTPSKNNPAFWTNGTIPWFRMEDIRTNGRILKDSIQHITEEAIKGSGLFPKFSIILSTTATIGEHALLIADSLANQQFTFLTRKVNRQNEIDIMYFYHYCFILGQWCRENINDGGLLAVNIADLKKHFFPLPPLPEQQKIAKALSDMDSLISSLDALIAKKRDIKKGTMQQLLTGKKRLPGFTEPWVEKKLGEVVDIVKGEQLNRDKMLGEAKYPVYNGGVSPSGYYTNYNTDEESIIISEGGNSCGFVNFVNRKFWRGGHCYGIFNYDGDNKFLYQLLKYNEINIMKLRAGSGLPNIQKNNLAAYSIVIPPTISEQTSIASILSSMDDEISALETKRDKYINIKQGMMQELLTGKTRLV